MFFNTYAYTNVVGNKTHWLDFNEEAIFFAGIEVASDKAHISDEKYTVHLELWDTGKVGCPFFRIYSNNPTVIPEKLFPGLEPYKFLKNAYFDGYPRHFLSRTRDFLFRKKMGKVSKYFLVPDELVRHNQARHGCEHPEFIALASLKTWHQKALTLLDMMASQQLSEIFGNKAVYGIYGSGEGIQLPGVYSVIKHIQPEMLFDPAEKRNLFNYFLKGENHGLTVTQLGEEYFPVSLMRMKNVSITESGIEQAVSVVLTEARMFEDEPPAPA